MDTLACDKGKKSQDLYIMMLLSNLADKDVLPERFLKVSVRNFNRNVIVNKYFFTCMPSKAIFFIPIMQMMDV